MKTIGMQVSFFDVYFIPVIAFCCVDLQVSQGSICGVLL